MTVWFSAMAKYFFALKRKEMIFSAKMADFSKRLIFMGIMK